MSILQYSGPEPEQKPRADPAYQPYSNSVSTPRPPMICPQANAANLYLDKTPAWASNAEPPLTEISSKLNNMSHHEIDLQLKS